MHLLLVNTIGNDEQKQPVIVVILGLDPGIQGVFNLNAKDSNILSLDKDHSCSREGNGKSQQESL